VKVTAPGGQDIAPGGSQKVVVSMSTRYFRDTLQKVIEIQTTDPDTPVITLTMKAKIIEILSVMPKEINFGDVKPGSMNKREITITNKDKESVTITKIAANPSTILTVSQQGEVKLKPEKSFTFELSFHPTQADEHFFGLLNIETNIENLQQKNVRIMARVVKN
jgi:HYDIN/CFA65/VesB-like, Ig-like domain